MLDEIAKAIAPQPVTRAIAKSVNELPTPAIKQAIIAFHEYKANEIAKGNKINSPIALMIAALKGEHQTPWTPNKPQAPTDWNDWFNAAQNLGLVRYSQGLPNGDIQVAMSDGNLRLFSELVQEYPLEKLKSQ
ncbi:MAG: hypothetical protein HC856_00235 [Pseudanabaena sp. RU_4_16]|nr:hypothetical protein [Pseudanabaena sp. SU_2_4]NJM27072.1 hypothetical protein [Pseudanabaena sp. RU_4_16]NKB17129.1 hypothetical protein [Pseudanabaena sp. CRU_2_10]